MNYSLITICLQRGDIGRFRNWLALRLLRLARKAFKEEWSLCVSEGAEVKIDMMPPNFKKWLGDSMRDEPTYKYRIANPPPREIVITIKEGDLLL